MENLSTLDESGIILTSALGPFATEAIVATENVLHSISESGEDIEIFQTRIGNQCASDVRIVLIATIPIRLELNCPEETLENINPILREIKEAAHCKTTSLTSQEIDSKLTKTIGTVIMIAVTHDSTSIIKLTNCEYSLSAISIAVSLLESLIVNDVVLSVKTIL
jgi:hypothetical protein